MWDSEIYVDNVQIANSQTASTSLIQIKAKLKQYGRNGWELVAVENLRTSNPTLIARVHYLRKAKSNGVGWPRTASLNGFAIEYRLALRRLSAFGLHKLAHLFNIGRVTLFGSIAADYAAPADAKLPLASSSRISTARL